MAAKARKTTFGVLVGNRGFFPDELAREGREIVIRRLGELGYGAVVLGPRDTKFGCVETWEDAKKCAELFRKHRDNLDGIIVTLPNFGDERGIADTLKLAGLEAPVLVHAWQDDATKMTLAHRRDSFCGKMSACNNLRQYGIRYSLTQRHTVNPDTRAFAEDIHWFASVCRVVRGLRNCRIGALGARPAAFNTVRFSEKLLQASGISVETLDLSEVFGRAGRLSEREPKVKRRLEAIKGYTKTGGVPSEALVKMAKLAVVVHDWMNTCELDAIAVQCWTSMEEFFGVVPCTVMSMLSDQLMSSACETDIAGTVSMHVLALASGSPSFLLDWNNNYGDEPDKCVCFHCSNLPKSCFEDTKMDFQDIIAGTVGKENTYGTIQGRIKKGPMTFCRVSTFDTEGSIAGYVGEGEFTNDPLKTFGGFGVARVPGMQELLQLICREGFEHHVAANHSQVARAVHEALTNYLDWHVHLHPG
ncbi:MAG: fucose isomerase [Candidatus Hydrogenedentes bacterium]|nr:fucose isomerase [Candidatus Hydrogenedentota bacterium]